MKVINGQSIIPFIFSAHHASDNFAEYSDRCALTQLERKAYSDYGTDMTVPVVGHYVLIAEQSRGLIDLNRAPDNPTRFATTDFSNPPNNIWLKDNELTKQERQSLHATHYVPFHNQIEQWVRSATEPLVVVAWDNTADKIVGKNVAGQDVRMPAIILSNNGSENATKNNVGEQTTCDPVLLQLIGEQVQTSLQHAGFQSDVHYNLVFRGGYIAQRYNAESLGLKCAVQSLQIEYSTALTHNQETLEPLPGKVADFRAAMEQALIAAYEQYKLLQ